MSIVKDPQAVLDYAFTWAAWLAAAETISSFTVTVPTGITLASPAPAQAAGVVTFWLSGGTVGTAYKVVCHITTNQGRQDDRTMTIKVVDR